MIRDDLAPRGGGAVVARAVRCVCANESCLCGLDWGEYTCHFLDRGGEGDYATILYSTYSTYSTGKEGIYETQKIYSVN